MLGAGKNGQMTYSRLDLSAASTDPFCGTYLGSFGGNGLEVLQIIRTTDKVSSRLSLSFFPPLSPFVLVV